MVHDYHLRYEEEKQRLERSELSEKNKEFIRKFESDLVLDNISKCRLIRYMQVLRKVDLMLGKDMDKAEINDLKQVLSDIQNSAVSPYTTEMYKIMVRKFYKWYKQTPGKEYPPIVAWINIRRSRSQRKLPSEGELLTEEDVQKLLNVAEHPRDKAIIAMLWESGARMGEIGNLLIKHVAFDKHGMVITVHGKTGSRRIRLISSTPQLSTWLNNHPKKNDKSANLWINTGTKNHNKPMKYPNFRRVLKALFKEAGIQKRCNPHMFRHSRATFMAHHLTEFQMNQYFGWVQGSDMPSTYVHMSGREVEKAIMTMNGIQTEETKKEAIIQPMVCPRCDTINAHDSIHCNKCAGILDLKYAMELEDNMQGQNKINDMMRALLEDKNMVQMLAQKMNELGLNKVS